MVAITYVNREPVADLHALLDHVQHNAGSLGVDADRIGIWASSGNVPLALSLLMQGEGVSFRCAVLAYGYMLDLDGTTAVAEGARMFRFANPNTGRSLDDLKPTVPLFIARAGEDQNPEAERVARPFCRGGTGPQSPDMRHESCGGASRIRSV